MCCAVLCLASCGLIMVMLLSPREKQCDEQFPVAPWTVAFSSIWGVSANPKERKSCTSIQTPSGYSFLVCQVIGNFYAWNNRGEETVCLWLHLKSHGGNIFPSPHQIKIHEQTGCAKRLFSHKAEVGAPFLNHNCVTKAYNLLLPFL